MDTEKLILADRFCRSHKIEYTFIYRLRDYGLISLIEEQDRVFIQAEELPKLEQILNFNRDLEINLEGIEVILKLLKRIEQLQEETNTLKNQVRLYRQL